jgi:hypothetical protein
MTEITGTGHPRPSVFLWHLRIGSRGQEENGKEKEINKEEDLERA